MKKLFFSVLTITGMLFANTSNAQNQYVALSGKSYDPNAATSSSEGMATLANTNQKAYKNFVSHYSNINDISVTDGKKTSIVVFKNAGILTRVCYSKKGECLNTIRYYDPAMLPQSVKDAIKADYAGYSIFGVTEVTVGEKTGYLVKIQNEKYWKTIKVVDGETEETEKFEKANP
ncbi:hypothetical protein [Pinibacter aurantiacus]|uniref:Beta-lactamase-inhibitor-like PepSY-like domain-containing protein n=1 Tax=Pinibacter aurantiacus TaxID=2851599 RepID=A0A9E2S5B4_9BACT|nr:hypothetical protein [Pinibacter aurantiacus]MBV4356036.1 hypothetical protein [Pinibacter aurantiacus]